MKILITMPKEGIGRRFMPEREERELANIGEIVWNESAANWSQEELMERIGGVDVCVTGWGSPLFDERVLSCADKLRCIAHTGGSVATLVTDAVYARGIPVLSGNELYARSVAESVIAYALYELRDLGKYSRMLAEEGWRGEVFANEGLQDQKVGLIGFGAVARYTARLLGAFGCEILICADHVTPEEAASYGARKADLDEIMSTCKVISLHLAKTPETYHLISAEKIAMIPDGAIFINTARGAIVDEQALAAELKTGRFKAALDVFEQEPLPMDSPLRGLNNVLLIPHMGGPTTDRYPFIARALIDEIPKAICGENSWLEITQEMMRRMTR